MTDNFHEVEIMKVKQVLLLMDNFLINAVLVKFVAIECFIFLACGNF